jgi:abhydrolase domain-containing protein 6
VRAEAPPEPSPSAPAILLLHGQPGGAADWDAVRAALGPEALTIAPDRPGWDRRRRATDLEGNARAALDELDSRGVGAAIVVGHSLGGTIAAWLAATHPDRVVALVLAAPAANAASLYRLDRWLAAPVAGELSSALSLAGLGLMLTLPPLRRRVATTIGIDVSYLEQARRPILRPGAWRSYLAEQRTLLRQMPQLEQRLAEIRAPTTILIGSGDRIVPPRAAVALSRQIRGAETRLVAGAGHLLPQTRPEAVAAAVRAALASV